MLSFSFGIMSKTRLDVTRVEKVACFAFKDDIDRVKCFDTISLPAFA